MILAVIKQSSLLREGGGIMIKRLPFTIAIVLFLSISLLHVSYSFSQPYYQGKKLTLMVPHSVGGGVDMFARLLAKHLPKYIPGEPIIIVRNMLGGMGLVCSNYVYLRAKKDGLTVLAAGGPSAMYSFLRTKGSKFTFNDMPIIMTVPGGEIFYARSKLCPTGEDIIKKGKNLVFGLGSMPYPLTVSFMLSKNLLEFETKKDVLAFGSSPDAKRAFMSNEIDIMGESTMRYVKGVLPLVKNGEVTPLWQSGVYDPKGRLVSEKGGVGDVPNIKEFYEKIYGREPSGPYWDALSAYIAYDRTITKSLFLPPGTEKYATILREAVVEMVKDPDFQRESEKLFLGAPIYTGQEAMDILDNAQTKADVARAWLQDWLHKGWGVEFEK
jgi:tripartite-type tricarboxylate transporter receptor subunit TctC